MKKFLKPAYLPWFVLIAGSIGIALRFWLLATGFDNKNLLISGHPADALLWVLTAITMAVIVIGCLPVVEANKYSFNFPKTPVGAIGEGVLALGILITNILTLTKPLDTLFIITLVVGFLSIPALILCGLFRWKGKKPVFFFHGLVSIYWVLRLISLYRIWSPEPQLQNYIFQLFAHVLIMISCYQRTAFDADQGNRKWHAITHLAAAFFCCLSMPGSGDWLLYGTGAAWAFTNLCRLTPMPNWNLMSQKKKDDNHDPA